MCSQLPKVTGITLVRLLGVLNNNTCIRLIIIVYYAEAAQTLKTQNNTTHKRKTVKIKTLALTLYHMDRQVIYHRLHSSTSTEFMATAWR